jgi:putative ABC transport system permease protein
MTVPDLSGTTEPVRLSLRDVLGLGLLGISTRKLRAALSALGISLGIATMIVVTGIPASSQAALLQELSALGTNILRAEPVPQQNGSPIQIPGSALGMVRRIGPVTGAAMVANVHSTVRRSDRVDPLDGAGLTVLASSPTLLGVLKGKVHSGTFLTKAGSHFPTVVLGAVAASRLGFDRVVPGQSAQVSIGGTWFTVVGILDPMPLAKDIERSVLVGWDAAKSTFGFDGHPTVVYVTAQEDQIEAVRSVLPATLYPQVAGLVQVSRPSDALAAKRATENNFSGLFLGLAGVALLVGGVGIANTMFISVLERRGEIGLRRALGATRGQIRGQFLTEAVALSGLGGAAGTLLGVAATVAYALLQGWPAVIPPVAVVLGVVGALAVGVVAGINPSIRAARLTPTEALATA